MTAEYEGIEDLLERIIGSMNPTGRMELAAELVLAKVVISEPYTLMDGVHRNGFLIYLAQKALGCALDPAFERELAGARITAEARAGAEESDHCSHPEDARLMAVRSGYLGDLPMHEVHLVCGDCGAEL